MEILSDVTIGIIGMFLVLMFIAAGVPVGISMGIIGFIGFACLGDLTAALFKLAATPFDILTDYTLLVLPLFTFMGYLVSEVGLSKDLFDLAYKWLGRLPGGLAIATIAACAIFAAVASSGLTGLIVFSSVAFPIMKKYGYDEKLSTGTICTGSTIGALIPPSAPLILFSFYSQDSLGKLFMAGVLPGIMVALFYVAIIIIWCLIKPTAGPKAPKIDMREKIAALLKCIDIVILICLVLGGIFVGWFTPNEAGAVGVFGTIIITLIRRRISWQMFKKAILDACRTTGMVFGILIGATLLNYFLTLSAVPTSLANVINSFNLSQVGVIIFVAVIYIFLGCFVDALSMILLTLPIFLPVIVSSGFPTILYGIIMVRLIEIATVTPPIGINIFVLGGLLPRTSYATIVRGIAPFLIADVVSVILLISFPQITLFLPSLMTT